MTWNLLIFWEVKTPELLMGLEADFEDLRDCKRFFSNGGLVMVAKYTYSMTIGTLKEFLVLNLMFGQFLQQVVIHLLRCLAFLQMGNGNGDLLEPWTKNICIKIVS